VQDLPQSHDIAAAQQHLKKGAIRELHWHRVVRISQDQLYVKVADKHETG
jgi:oxalate decarboxylase/phosphoglucose isomerase-like protein (cupin superfamily)